MIGNSWLGANNEPWVAYALCAETDPDAFFPDRGGSTREAKRTCMACDVRAECLDYALRNNERFGVWGGMSERPRRKLIDQRHRDGTLHTEPDHDAA